MDGEVERAMTGRPQTILELLQILTGWRQEDIVQAFGHADGQKIEEETEDERH